MTIGKSIRRAGLAALLIMSMMAPSYADAKLDELTNIIQENYVSDVSSEQLAEGTYKGLFETLDPYSAYFTKDEYKQFSESTSGTYGGIGISLEKSGDFIKVIEVFPGTPAEKAGIRSNDVITEVNGESVDGMDTDIFVKKTKGDPGTTVVLKVMRGSVVKKFSMVRAIVRISPISSKVIDGCAYIRISQFNDSAFSSFKSILDDMESRSVKGYVIDLRNNPGGYLSQVLRIAELFIKSGEELLFVDMKGSDSDETYTSSNSSPVTGKKMVVLINGNSASASEIFAGIMKDYSAATLVGEKSFGKGSVQTVMGLADGSGFKLTIAEYFTPSRKKIHGVGVTPNVVISRNLKPELFDRGSLQPFMTSRIYKSAGAKGLDIAAAQQRLKVLGYDVKVNATLDRKTYDALKKFKSRNGIKSAYILNSDIEKALDVQTGETYEGKGPDYQLEKALSLLK